LPTEAEWEYAARAGTTSPYYWGFDIDEGKADCAACGSEWDGDRTAPVGSLPPNAWGLLDMAGNVWQWTADCWNESYTGAPPEGNSWTMGNCRKHPLRGGSWRDDAAFVRAAVRGNADIGSRFSNIGFRLAKDLYPSSSAAR
jgi:formylglycine-generating enzyme required for sulfatase activity